MPASACSECGNRVRDGARFCPACGSTVATVALSAHASPPAAAVSVLSPPQMSPPRESACAECGHALRAGVQFCPACGSAVTTPPAAAAVVPTSVPAVVPGVEADTELAAPVVALTPSPPPTVPPETSPLVDSRGVATPPVPPVDQPPTDRGHRRVDDRRVLVGAIGVVALVLAGILVVVLTAGGSSKHGPSPLAKSVAHTSSTVAPPAATATATGQAAPLTTSTAQAAPLTTATTQAAATTETRATGTTTTPVSNPITQVASLEAILSLAARGRQALANGDITATIANRRSVLARLDAFHPDAELAASVAALKAAESFSLYADTTCGRNCAASINQHSTDLKQTFLARFNPIATKYGSATYTAGQI
jgi:RNA polymerase subunit RPABC4/transcription elongation factor Spt4